MVIRVDLLANDSKDESALLLLVGAPNGNYLLDRFLGPVSNRSVGLIEKLYFFLDAAVDKVPPALALDADRTSSGVRLMS